MRSTLLLLSASLALPFLAGCCVIGHALGIETPCNTDQMVTEAYPSYTGTDTETLDAIDVVPNTPFDGEPYYTFRFNRANPADPSVSNDSGKLCGCDLASATPLEQPIHTAYGEKTVIRLVYRSGALLNDTTAPCPKRPDRPASPAPATGS